MQNKKLAIISLAAFAFLALLLTFVSAVREIAPQVAEYRAAEREYQAIRAVARAPMDGMGDVETGAQQGIDWIALQRLNPDIVGWIVVEGTTIDYPIVRGHDNETYLHWTVLGERNSSGAIFMDHRNHGDFFDPHTLIYGHNSATRS